MKFSKNSEVTVQKVQKDVLALHLSQLKSKDQAWTKITQQPHWQEINKAPFKQWLYKIIMINIINNRVSLNMIRPMASIINIIISNSLDKEEIKDYIIKTPKIMAHNQITARRKEEIIGIWRVPSVWLEKRMRLFNKIHLIDKFHQGDHNNNQIKGLLAVLKEKFLELLKKQRATTHQCLLEMIMIFPNKLKMQEEDSSETVKSAPPSTPTAN